MQDEARKPQHLERSYCALPPSALFIILSFVFVLLSLGRAGAQSKAAAHATQRYEIDAKRSGVDPGSEDALPRSREFIRLDSTYYVGWMFEGIYKYNHAADYIGYKHATTSLARALATLERDYAPQLRTRTSDLLTYINAFKYQLDYTLIAYYLQTSYANTEDPEATFSVLRRAKKWNFQRDYYLDFYNMMAWTVHRNRFYTRAKYSFLENSIDANEALADRFLDSALRRIRINTSLNRQIFPPGYEQDEYLSVYHYKSMMAAYALRVDSAEYWFGKMRGTRIFPHNNYANFQATIGFFEKAAQEYEQASLQDMADKRLQEWVYFTSILDIYRHHPKRAEVFLREWIKAVGSTPGFGWYNIALSRCLLYDGQLGEAGRIANKAAEFKELHIGTTLGQSHYDFAIQLLKLLNKENERAAQQFEHANWWYNPKVLIRMAGLQGQQYLQQYLIITQFAQNPERDRVIYKLFATESVVSWDEVWFLIRDFSTNYFLKRFQKELKEDPRPRIQKYFKYFVARLQIKNGEYTEGRRLLLEVLADTTMGGQYETLLKARCYEALAVCAEVKKSMAEQQEWLYKLYTTYPQLLPFSGQKPKLNFTASGTVDEAVVKRLYACNIAFVPPDATTPRATAFFYQQGDTKMVRYSAVDASGNSVVEEQSISYKDPEAFGVSLAYRLFNVGGISGADTTTAGAVAASEPK